MQLFVVFAVRRSGHHAVVHWICSQHGAITHLNDVHLDEAKMQFIPNSLSSGIFAYGAGRPDLLVNLEDFSLERWETEKWCYVPSVQEAKPVRYILVVRSFPSWLASVIGYRRYQESTATPDAREAFIALKFDAYANHMQAILDQKFFDNLTVVRFDDWFASVTYRKELAEQLGLTWTDQGLNDVHTCGGGSSFDRRVFHGRAQEMNVLRRHEQVTNTKDYQELFQRGKELNKLSQAVFAGGVTQLVRVSS